MVREDLFLEFIIVMCQSFYLPREFTAILLAVVYIPPGASASNRSKAPRVLHRATDEWTDDTLLITAGSFNQGLSALQVRRHVQ